ncbi:hypothetical protein [Cerasicoccus maritimus]|uniref:hypothetical protein n=1 Tax=Cerasicoccus maritimus TaxID=490089 RepID=UPI002852A7C5|nr:hypothetical protein [Cerasicoccus maritimus]
MNYSSITLFFFYASFSLFGGEIKISNGDVLNGNSYKYYLTYVDMDSGQFEADVYYTENVVCKTQLGTGFVSAEPYDENNNPVSSAQLIYKFNFSESGYYPSSVTWQNHLTLFSPVSLGSNRFIATSEWSLDGVHYFPLSEVETIVGQKVEVGEVHEDISLPDHTLFVYYRVRFEAFDENGGRGQFIGDSAQWNRTADQPALFNANFELVPAQLETSTLDLVSVSSAPDAHIKEGVAYPESFTSMDFDDEWDTFGKTDGNDATYAAVPAPGGRQGKAIEITAKASSNVDAPKWITWEHKLSPAMNIQGAEELVFDIYVDSLQELPAGYSMLDTSEFPFIVQLGLGNGPGIIAATWSQFGELQPGWNEVRLPINEVRLNVDGFRINLNTTDVPENERVRFFIDNLRLEPEPFPQLSVYSSGGTVTGNSIDAIYLQQISEDEYVSGEIAPDNSSDYVNLELSDGEPFCFKMEIDSNYSGDAVLKVSGESATFPLDDGFIWEGGISLNAGMNYINARVTNPLLRLGYGEHVFSVSLYIDGNLVAELPTAFPLEIYSSGTIWGRMAILTNRLDDLDQEVLSLEGLGIVVDEPKITLEVVRFYLSEREQLNEYGGVIQNSALLPSWIEYDYADQRARSIVMEMLDDLEYLLDCAEYDLVLRAEETVIEVEVSDYDATQYVTTSAGAVRQGSDPLFLIGALTRPIDGVSNLPKMGFNAMVAETSITAGWGVAGWASNGSWFVKKYLELGYTHNVATSILLSSHYANKSIMEGLGYYDVITGEEGVGMFPWNVLKVDTDPVDPENPKGSADVFDKWYTKFATKVSETNYPQVLVSVGTANEPGYGATSDSIAFEEELIAWARADSQYGFESTTAEQNQNSSEADTRWWGNDVGSYFGDFDNITLSEFFRARETSNAAEYDWQRLLDNRVNQFLGGRKDFLRSQPAIGHAEVWVKLMGRDEHFGYGQLNEQQNVKTAQTVLGTDGHDPMWLDYLRSLDPSKPIYNTEWHFLEDINPNDQNAIANRMFEGVVHGIDVGLIWIWARTDWNSNVVGADESMTRWPLTLDAIGRTSLRLRSLAGKLNDLANIDSPVRVLFSIDSNLHGNHGDYMEETRRVYDQMRTFPTGVGFLPTSLAGEVLNDPVTGPDVKLIAAHHTDCLELSAVKALKAWVDDHGGVLWFSTPVTLSNRWDEAFSAQDLASDNALDFLNTVSGVNGSSYSSASGGMVVVQENMPVLQGDSILHPLLTDQTVYVGSGPWDTALESLELRKGISGGNPILAIINHSNSAFDFSLSGGEWEDASVDDLWNRANVNTDNLTIQPYGVMLLEIPNEW